MAARPEVVARTVRRAIEASEPRAYYRVGKDAWIALALGTFAPVRLRDWMTKRLYGFSRRGPVI